MRKVQYEKLLVIFVMKNNFLTEFCHLILLFNLDMKMGFVTDVNNK